MHAKYNEFLHEVQSTKDSRYTFNSLSTYADQLLAVFESELLIIKKYQNKYINTSENLRAINSGLKSCDVTNTILAPFPTSTDPRLLDVIEFAKKLADRDLLVRMNIRELQVIIKRINHLNERNVL